jgi:hypothetical protein
MSDRPDPPLLDDGFQDPTERELRRHAYAVSAYHAAVILVVAVVSIIVSYDLVPGVKQFQKAVYVVGFGAVGATIHASRYVIYSVAHRRYQRRKLLWQIMTPVHSAVLSVIAYVAINAGLLTLATAPSPKEPQYTWFVIISSFLVGFASETFVKRLIMAAESLFGERGDLEGESKPSREDRPRPQDDDEDKL